MNATNHLEHLSSLIQRQSSTFADLNANMNYEQMAAAVARHMLPEQGRFLAIAEFVYESEQIIGWRIVASANRDRSFRWDEGAMHKWEIVPPDVAASIASGKPFLLPSVKAAVEEGIYPEYHNLLLASGVETFVNIPMIVENKAVAALFIMSRHSVMFSPDELNTFTNLGDQMATIIYARNLLEEARQAQQFALEIVDTNRDIVQAETNNELASSILGALPASVSGLSLSLFNKPLEPGENPGYLETQFIASRTGISSDSSQYVLGGDENGVRDMLRRVRDNQFITMSTADPLRGVLPVDSIEKLREYGATAITVLGLQTGKRLLGLLGLGSTKAVDHHDTQANSLRAIADQIAITLENRRLLKQTTTTLEETRLLYDVNRDILATQDMLDILRVIRNRLAPDSSIISHSVVEYIDDNHISDFITTTLITPESEQVVRMSVGEQIGQQTLENLAQYWRVHQDPVVLIEDLDGADSNYPLSQFIRNFGVRSFITVLIRVRGLVREVIGISFTAPQVFSERRRRLYTSLSDQIAIVVQNHHLLEDAQISAQKLNEQLSTLHKLQEIGEKVNAVKDEKTLLSATAKDLQELLNVDHCGIVLINPDRVTASVVSEYPAKGTVGAEFAIKNNSLYRFIDSKDYRPIVVNDISDDPNLDANTRQVLQTFDTQAVMLLPLVVQDEVIGSIGVDMYTVGHPFTIRVVELAQTVSSQIALALQSLRLVAETQRRAEQLQHIAAFSQSAQTILDKDAILRYMLTESSSMLPQNQISINLYDESSQELRVAAQRVDGETRLTPNDGERLPIIGYLARVWETGEYIYIPDLRAVTNDMDPGVSLRSWLLVPVLARGLVTGIVSVGSDQPYAYSDSDANIFGQMVTQFGIVLENTESYRQSQRVARNESLVNDISSQLQRQLDIESMLNVTATELGKALGARRARIRLGVQPDTDA